MCDKSEFANTQLEMIIRHNVSTSGDKKKKRLGHQVATY